MKITLAQYAEMVAACLTKRGHSLVEIDHILTEVRRVAWAAGINDEPAIRIKSCPERRRVFLYPATFVVFQMLSGSTVAEIDAVCEDARRLIWGAVLPPSKDDAFLSRPVRWQEN